MYTHVYQKICEVVKTNGFDDTELPPPCEYRILMSTKTVGHLDEATLCKVQNTSHVVKEPAELTMSLY